MSNFEDEVCIYDYEPPSRESEWVKGYHIMKDGGRIPIDLMQDSHIKNTIKFFSKHDTGALEDELKRRERIRNRS